MIDFPLADAEEIRRFERRLNLRPREGLDWRIPEEAFIQTLQATGEAAERESLP